MYGRTLANAGDRKDCLYLKPFINECRAYDVHEPRGGRRILPEDEYHGYQDQEGRQRVDKVWPDRDFCVLAENLVSQK